jgi:hypothetical protein
MPWCGNSRAWGVAPCLLQGPHVYTVSEGPESQRGPPCVYIVSEGPESQRGPSCVCVLCMCECVNGINSKISSMEPGYRDAVMRAEGRD